MSEPLVLISGFMSDARVFLPQILRFGVDRPLIILTMGAASNVARLAQEMAPKLPEKFAMMGHGLGGNVAIELVRKRPQAISRMVLISTDPLPKPRQEVAAEEALVVAAKTGRLAKCIQLLVPENALFAGPKRSEILALLQEMAAALGPDQFLLQLRATQRRPAQEKTLCKTVVPTLVLNGLHDRIVPPRRGKFLAGMMANALPDVIADAGHFPQLEQPEAVNARLESFLAGRLPTLLLS